MYKAIANEGGLEKLLSIAQTIVNDASITNCIVFTMTEAGLRNHYLTKGPNCKLTKMTSCGHNDAQEISSL